MYDTKTTYMAVSRTALVVIVRSLIQEEAKRQKQVVNVTTKIRVKSREH